MRTPNFSMISVQRRDLDFKVVVGHNSSVCKYKITSDLIMSEIVQEGVIHFTHFVAYKIMRLFTPISALSQVALCVLVFRKLRIGKLLVMMSGIIKQNQYGD